MSSEPSKRDQRLARVIGLYLFGTVLSAALIAGKSLIGMAEIGLQSIDYTILNAPIIVIGFILSIRLTLRDQPNWALVLLPSLVLPMGGLAFYVYALTNHLLG